MDSSELRIPTTKVVHNNVLQTNLKPCVNDQFTVEDLLDFSNDLAGDGILDFGGGDFSFLDFGNSGVSSCLAVVQDCRSNPPSRSGGDCAACPDLSEELYNVTNDQVEDLKWLSTNLVPESFYGDELDKFHLISGVKSPCFSEIQSSFSTTAIATSDTNTITVDCDTEKPVLGNSRSKRVRTAPMNWDSRLLLVSETDEDTDTVLSESELLNPPSPPPKAENLKTVKEKERNHHTDRLIPSPEVRKCLHCATDKTPQWRTGPSGPKTLCNACGVRYKSGRLMPEYRPAASPTFVITKHSNSHRKVLELRRQKETVYQHPNHQQQHQNNQQYMHHHNHSTAAIYEATAIGDGDEFFVHHLPHHLNQNFRHLIG